jgi:hypothetical protein
MRLIVFFTLALLVGCGGQAHAGYWDTQVFANTSTGVGQTMVIPVGSRMVGYRKEITVSGYKAGAFVNASSVTVIQEKVCDGGDWITVTTLTNQGRYAWESVAKQVRVVVTITKNKIQACFGTLENGTD